MLFNIYCLHFHIFTFLNHNAKLRYFFQLHKHYIFTLPIYIRLRRSRTSEMTSFFYKYAIPSELDCKDI